MAIKKICLIMFLSICAFFPLPNYAQIPMGQTLLIQTHFSDVVGKPEWLLVVRDVQSGVVLPYLYEIKNNDNFWIAFTAGRTYRVTASTLKFGPYAKIHNFCGLENGILTGKSMSISLTGELSPNPNSFKCHVSQFSDNPISVAADSN